MSQLKFEGEIETITEGQLEFIRNVIEKEGYKDSKVTIEAVGGAADNYGANVKRIVIEGENGKLSMIAKIAPSFELIRKAMAVVDLMFSNESLIYTEILPKMLQLQKQAEVPEEDQLKFPKCYGTNLEAPHEVILIEDLKASGFAMLDRFKSLSDNEMTSILRNLAIYHSLSYVLRNKEPETYDYFKDKLHDMLRAMTQGSPEMLGFFYQLETLAVQMLDDKEQQNIVKNKIGEVIKLVGKMAKFEHSSRYSVIQHGDCWTNNIMFKFEGETVKQSMLIDYQQSKNFSPVYDLFYLIFNCTDHETRIKNFYDWIDYYHDELDKSLSNFGLKANFVYPRDQLDADLKRYGKLAFGCAILMTGTLTISAQEAGKLKDTMSSGNLEDMAGAMGNFQAETLGLFKKRIVGLIGETVKQSMLIDYQQSKNFSPVYDLFYLIFNCTDHETRIKNFYDWIDYYHDELDKSLSNFGLKANFIYPRDQLDADLKRYGKLAFGCAILMTGTLTISAQEAGKLKDTMSSGNLEDMAGAMGNFQAETLGLFKKRIVGLIESFTTFGLL